MPSQECCEEFPPSVCAQSIAIEKQSQNPASSQPSTKVTFSETVLFLRMNLAVFLP
jgi:hypothetical protein